MENGRILVIEDNEVQMLWAKESLKNYTLNLVSSVCDAQTILKKESFDIVLCDLELPFNESLSKVSWYNGTCLFKGEIIPLLEAGKIKGVGLVSNFEHHCHKFSNKEIQLIYNETKGISTKGSFPFVTCGDTFSFERKGSGLNLLVIFDVGLDPYENFYFEGDILSAGEIIKIFPIQEDGSIPRIPSLSFEKCLKKGGVNLKPYKSIAEALLS